MAQRVTPTSAGSSLARRRFFDGDGLPTAWQQVRSDSRGWERFYRQRWQHDKVVRSTTV